MDEPPKKVNPTPSSIPITDARYPIWGRLFLCRAPRIAYYSTKYLETFGMHTSGNQNVDRELAKQLHPVYLTINDMIEYFHQTQVIAIVNRQDVKTVYEICQDYTFNAANRIDRTIFSHNMPFADLIKIDEFAQEVYEHAGYEYGEEFARTFLPDNVMKDAIDLNKMFAAIDEKVKNRGKIKDDQYTVNTQYSPIVATRRSEEERKSKEERPKLPERPSMRDLFLSYMDSEGVSGRL